MLILRKPVLVGASIVLATGIAAAQSTATSTTKTPNKSMGMNATGVTGQVKGMQSGSMSHTGNAPAMQSSKHTMPTQRRSTMSKTMTHSGASD